MLGNGDKQSKCQENKTVYKKDKPEKVYGFSASKPEIADTVKKKKKK